MYDYKLAHGLWSTVWLDSQGFGRNMFGKFMRRKSGEEVQGLTLLIGPKHEDICIPCNCSAKGDLSRGEF